MTDTPQHSGPQAGFRVAKLSQNAPTPFSLLPEKPVLDTLARDLGLSALRKLRFEGEIRSFGKADWILTGHLGATVVQPCVVTLDPVTTRIETDVERRFLADMAMPDEEEDTELEMHEDENAEPLGSHIDPVAVMEEALALAMPLYPRVDGAEMSETVFTEPGKVAMRDEDARPFAGLAGLRDKLADKGDADG